MQELSSENERNERHKLLVEEQEAEIGLLKVMV